MAKNLKTLVKLAHYYYRDGLTQGQIAERMSMSRQKINRLLKKALKEEIVKIEIVEYMSQNIEVERSLEKVFGFKNAVVISEPDNEKLLERLGAAAANYLSMYLKSDKTIGVGWGRTIRFVAENINEKHKGISIVQIAGGPSSKGIDIPQEHTAKSDEIVIMFSQRLEGVPYFLHAPVFVDSKDIKNALMKDQYLKDRFEMITKCDIAVMGIGGIGKNITPFKEGYVGNEVLEELEKKGAVGHVGFRYFNVNGDPVYTSLEDRVIVPTVEQLRKIPLKVGIGGGEEKRKAVLGAARNKRIDVLITNIDTAQYMLQSI